MTQFSARRHYVERGTLRYFELRYSHASALTEALTKPSDADGLVLVALVDTEDEQMAAIRSASTPPFIDRPDVLVGIVQPLLGLGPELQDARCWQWVADHTPELSDDAYAAAEVTRQVTATRRALASRTQWPSGITRRRGNRRAMVPVRGFNIRSKARRGLRAAFRCLRPTLSVGATDYQ